MSARSKRMRFAASQKRKRRHSTVVKANSHRPGFIGVCRDLRINGVLISGCGVLFMGTLKTPYKV